jgi:hypothetical protein
VCRKDACDAAEHHKENKSYLDEGNEIEAVLKHKYSISGTWCLC